MALKHLVLFASLAWSASVVERKRENACSSYTLVNTRGSGEPQGESSGFRIMNQNILQEVPGGEIYNTVYPAEAFSNETAEGTRDIIEKVTSTLTSNPKECFILEGYSLGAAATTDALPKLTGSAFDAIKGVFLIGNPDHKAGLACNVDNNGGDSTRNVDGIWVSQSQGIPDNWVSKTLDVCIFADGVCDTTNGIPPPNSPEHLQYPNDTATQQLGTDFVVGQLTGGN